MPRQLTKCSWLRQETEKKSEIKREQRRPVSEALPNNAKQGKTSGHTENIAVPVTCFLGREVLNAWVFLQQSYHSRKQCHLSLSSKSVANYARINIGNGPYF